MIGERQRHETPPGQPPADVAEEDSIVQLERGGDVVKATGSYLYSALQRLEPRRRVKNGSPRVTPL